MREEHSRNYDTLTFDPSIKLPDSVGKHINIEKG
jgi:hypothetical protein